MEFKEIVKGLGERLGVEIELSSEGASDLEVDGLPIVVRMTDDGSAVSLFGAVGEPPPERLETLFAALLKANHLFAGAAGASASGRGGSGSRCSFPRALSRSRWIV